MRSVGISAFVMAGLLLGQVVSIRHSHDDRDLIQHATVPHFHLSWLSATSSHSHAGESDHRHDHDAIGHENSAPTKPSPDKHHEDAVYVSELVAVVSEGKTSVVNDPNFGEPVEVDLTFVPTVILTLAQAVLRPPLKTDLQELSVFLRTFSLRI